MPRALTRVCIDSTRLRGWFGRSLFSAKSKSKHLSRHPILVSVIRFALLRKSRPSSAPQHQSPASFEHLFAMSTPDLSSFHFAHNPKCDCGIAEAYASKQQAVQATRRHREKCLRHYKKARKLHAPYSIKRHRKSRKQFKPLKKSLDIPKWTVVNAPIDPPKYATQAESVNGEMTARQLCQTFYRAGRDFAMELDGFHIFKGEMKAFYRGEYTSVLDPRLWTDRLYDFRDRMGRYAGSLLDHVSMAEVPTSPKFSKQFRATRASAIYFWWRICGIIEDFFVDCEVRRQYGLGVEWEHQCFVKDVLRMKNMVGNMWYALGMVLWNDMQKPEGFRWNVIHVHL